MTTGTAPAARNTPRGVDSIDDLELELRKLPGVIAAGFEEHEEMLYVQLHVSRRAAVDEHPVPVAASRISARHADRPIAVEIVRWRDASHRVLEPPAAAGAPVDLTGDEADELADAGDGSRARLLAVLAFPDSDELEVHLVHGGRRTIGRSTASEGLAGAAGATIDALRSLGAPVDARVAWARALEHDDDDRVVVAVAVAAQGSEQTDYGLAAGASPIDAAARATLDALNRRLAIAMRASA